MSSPSKVELKAELVRVVEAALATAIAAHQAATEGATHAEAKPENDKDTRALEASYMARGQAVRVEELRGGLAAVQALTTRPFGERDPAALGALVTVADDEGERRYLVAPDGGGAALAGGAVQVITPRSPLGRALVGKRVGDDCTVVVGGKTRELEIAAIA